MADSFDSVDPSEARDRIEEAAQALAAAEALLITSGAGMGVDSGLPDFRGDQGFWNAYPAFAKLKLRFMDLADPHWFESDSGLAWGFYGHRYHLYRQTTPHAGFGILRRWAASMPRGHFVFTSNVDGHFAKAGFAPSEIMECHGSIHHLQCTRPCCQAIWPAEDAVPEIDPDTCRALGTLPRCPHCKSLARPNILMFGDGQWVCKRTDEQNRRFEKWLSERLDCRLVVLEIGAGTSVPTIRQLGNTICSPQVAPAARLIRVNVREPAVPSGQVGIAAGALETLRELDERLPQLGKTGGRAG